MLLVLGETTHGMVIYTWYIFLDSRSLNTFGKCSLLPKHEKIDTADVHPLRSEVVELGKIVFTLFLDRANKHRHNTSVIDVAGR